MKEGTGPGVKVLTKRKRAGKRPDTSGLQAGVHFNESGEAEKDSSSSILLPIKAFGDPRTG